MSTGKKLKRVGDTRLDTLTDVIAETDRHWWVDPEDPYTISKSSGAWEEYVPVPEVGDVWTSGGSSSSGGGHRYRVVGVSEKRGEYVLVRDKDFNYGQGWPERKGLQADAVLRNDDGGPDVLVYVRKLPEEYLKLKERP